jgi:ATP-dependent DNA helicase RecG
VLVVSRKPLYQSFRTRNFRIFEGVIFTKDRYTEEYLKGLECNDRQIKAVMYTKAKGRITNKEYRELTQLSDEGVRKDLNELVEKGVLQLQGKGRGVHYVLR